MNASRTALIPIAHLAAEVIAYPFASEASLLRAPIKLCPKLSGESFDLWRSAEQDLLRSNPAVALDELVAIRDDIWFHGTRETIALGTYLQSVAQRFLVVRGAKVLPRLELREAGPPGREGDGVARSFWRWLSFALPPDLLLAVLRDGEQSPREFQAYSPLLDRRLRDRGFAELHVHLNGCFDFASIWVSALRGLADPELKVDAFKSPGSCLKEGRDLAGWLVRAALARYVLAAFLDQRSENQELETFLRDRVIGRIQASLGQSAAYTLVQALEDLRGGSLSDLGFEKIQFLYAGIIDKRRSPLPIEPEEVWAWDPIAPIIGCVDSPPELRFIAHSLQYTLSHQRDDLFCRLFWQEVRVRCLFYRHLVQRPMTPGLQWFVRFFRRIKPARRLLKTHVKARIAAALCGADQGLRSLEVRVAPEASVSESFEQIVDIDRAFRAKGKRDEDCFEFGVVWHFGRDREGGWFEGKPRAHWMETAADPTIRSSKKGLNSTGYRYGSYYKGKRKEAQAAARVLTGFPRMLGIIRGLDLCTDEIGIPTWVMAPLVRYVRAAGEAASAVLREHCEEEFPPLRTTIHAGEDFVHLLSGLRRLDEAIEYLQLRDGDRLGHALSLGVDAEKWAAHVGRVPIPREERLLDVAWEWNCYARLGRAAPGGRQTLLQREIAEHARYVFGQEMAPWEVCQVVRELHHEESLCLLGFPDRPYNEEFREGRSESTYRYLTNPGVFERGREILWIDPTDEADAIQFLQRELRRKISRMGLTIEVNPSSNLLIGHLGDMENHPLWNLCPPTDKGEGPPLPVCIGSDDPLTFATTLREEYQLLYDVLVQQESAEVANEWLERARSVGWNARFTLPETRRPWPAKAGCRDFGREALTFSPLAWIPKLDLPP